MSVAWLESVRRLPCVATRSSLLQLRLKNGGQIVNHSSVFPGRDWRRRHPTHFCLDVGIDGGSSILRQGRRSDDAQREERNDDTRTGWCARHNHPPESALTTLCAYCAGTTRSRSPRNVPTQSSLPTWTVTVPLLNSGVLGRFNTSVTLSVSG